MDDKETIKAQSAQISKMIELSEKQSEEIAQLTAALEAERKTASLLRQASRIPVGQPAVPVANQFFIEGSAYITKTNGASTVLRDLRVILLSNAQIRWSSYVKPATVYSEGFNEEKLRSDLAQFSGSMADLVIAETTTDADGKYKFSNIAPGDYYLFAQYSGVDSTIGWFIPMNIQQGSGSSEINLANSTAYAISYREVR